MFTAFEDGEGTGYCRPVKNHLEQAYAQPKRGSAAEDGTSQSSIPFREPHLGSAYPQTEIAEAKFVARDWSDVDKCCPWPFTQPRIYPDSLRATVIAMGRESWGD